MKYLTLPFILALILTAGCAANTPPAVIALVQQEGELIDSRIAFDDEVLATAYADLEAAYEAHANTILQYKMENAATDSQVPLAKVLSILAEYQAKMTDIKAQLAAIRTQMKQKDIAAEQIRALHAKALQYLQMQRLELKDLTDAMNALKGGAK